MLGLALPATAVIEPDVLIRNVITVDHNHESTGEAVHISVVDGRIAAVSQDAPQTASSTTILEAANYHFIQGECDTSDEQVVERRLYFPTIALKHDLEVGASADGVLFNYLPPEAPGAIAGMLCRGEYWSGRRLDAIIEELMHDPHSEENSKTE